MFIKKIPFQQFSDISFAISRFMHVASLQLYMALSMHYLIMALVNGAFSQDDTAAILVFQDNEMAAMLFYQTNPVGVELFSYVKPFFCSNTYSLLVAM